MKNKPGDIFKRRFSGNVAQCGCYWERDSRFGDVLNLCPIHKQASEVYWKKSKV